MPLPDMNVGVASVVETAYAKINVALHVRARRADGYHALESLFVFARDGDRITASENDDGEIDLTIDGPFAEGLDTGPSNLVVRAARALQSYLGTDRGAALHLAKALPVASGIGGGSADAAATLRLLVRLWDARIGRDELAALALDLGSDVPACLDSVTQMVAGRGETLLPHHVDGLDGMPMLLVNPGVSLSTAAVFAGWDRQDKGALDGSSLDALIARGRNDLEVPARRIAPVIDDVLLALGEAEGVRLARMSGSGATCFALFEEPAAMAAAAAMLRAAHHDWWIMETGVRGG